MLTPLYTTADGFDKAAIMRAAWDACRGRKSFAALSIRDRRREFAAALKKAWRIARNQRAARQQEARTAAVVALDTRTPAQVATDAARLANEVNRLDGRPFRYAA